MLGQALYQLSRMPRPASMSEKNWSLPPYSQVPQVWAAMGGSQPSLPSPGRPLHSLTCAPMWTLAVEGSYTVMAGGTLETGSTSTVVDVLTAVLASPAIDTHAVVATMGIVAGPAILTGVGHELTLVHILCAVLTCRGHRTINFPSCYTPTPGRGLEATLSRKSSQLTCATCTSYPILQPKGLSPHG